MAFPTSKKGTRATGKGDGANLLEELRLLCLVCIGSKLDSIDGF